MEGEVVALVNGLGASEPWFKQLAAHGVVTSSEYFGLVEFERVAGSPRPAICSASSHLRCTIRLLGHDFNIWFYCINDFDQVDALTRLSCNHQDPDEDALIATVSIEDNRWHRGTRCSLATQWVTFAEIIFSIGLGFGTGSYLVFHANKRSCCLAAGKDKKLNL
ncbi:hypothetical protein SprV_0100184000 [Sparganum proliferum]